MPGKRFDDLVEELRNERFFKIERTDPTRFVEDASVIRLTYRNERRIHEVVDSGRGSVRITKLENRFKTLTDVSRYLTPSVSLYGRLLNAGWNVNKLGADQQNALSSAVSHHELESARFLLEHGSKITPETLGYAAASGNVDLLRLIIPPTHRALTGDLGAIALCNAVRSRNAGQSRYLLDLGTDPNVQESGSGFTPLMCAVESEQLANVALLLVRGADPNVRDSSGHTALWYAASAMNTGFIALLLQHRAVVDVPDNEGQTALRKAADYCYTWDLNALLRGGADPTIKDKRGKTAQDARMGLDPKCKMTQKLLREAVQARHDHASATSVH